MVEQSRGGGVAVGTDSWYANGVALQPGVNAITITAEDSGGNLTSDTLSITYSPSGADSLRPILSVNSPGTKPLSILDNHIACTGSASGQAALTEVVVQVNDGPWLEASGTASWSDDVSLTPGLNVVRFKAIDATGRESLAVSRTVTYRKLVPLTVTTLGNGSAVVVGKPNTAMLEVGRLYTVDGIPAKGSIFVGWEGGVVSDSKRISFVMEEGLTLQASFASNPFGDLAATFRGLVRAEPLAHATSGAATVTLTKTGAVSAQIIIGGQKLVLKGAFDGTGTLLGRL